MNETPAQMLSRLKEMVALPTDDRLNEQEVAALQFVLESRATAIELCRQIIVRTSVDLLGGDYDREASIGRDLFEDIKSLLAKEQSNG